MKEKKTRHDVTARSHWNDGFYRGKKSPKCPKIFQVCELQISQNQSNYPILSLLNGYFIGNINPTFSGPNPFKSRSDYHWWHRRKQMLTWTIWPRPSLETQARLGELELDGAKEGLHTPLIIVILLDGIWSICIMYIYICILLSMYTYIHIYYLQLFVYHNVSTISKYTTWCLVDSRFSKGLQPAPAIGWPCWVKPLLRPRACIIFVSNSI